MIKFVIQANLSDSASTKLAEACAANGNPVQMISGAAEISKVNVTDPSVFYGSVDMLLAVKDLVNGKEAILSPSFNCEVWTKMWTDLCLNCSGISTTLDYFTAAMTVKEKQGKEKYFIRPCADTKSFTGSVMESGAIADWAFSLALFDPELLRSRIVVSKPRPISQEWRLFMINKSVSTGSCYQKDGVSDQSTDIPEGVIKFAEAVADIWTPAPIFTLDIALCSEKLYVVECGCFNYSGFYGADLVKLVKDINGYFEGK